MLAHRRKVVVSEERAERALAHRRVQLVGGRRELELLRRAELLGDGDSDVHEQYKCW